MPGPPFIQVHKTKAQAKEPMKMIGNTGAFSILSPALTTCAALGLISFGTTLGHAAAPLAVQQLKCEYRVNPVGLDLVRPRLSWIVASNRRGQRQSAYQILVAASAA